MHKRYICFVLTLDQNNKNGIRHIWNQGLTLHSSWDILNFVQCTKKLGFVFLFSNLSFIAQYLQLQSFINVSFHQDVQL